MKKLLLKIFSILGFASLATGSTMPPVPEWKPKFQVSHKLVIDRMKYYSDNKKDLVIFENGTVVLLPDGLTDTEALSFAKETLNKIISSHPDMKPQNMDDGNILISYNHPAYNVIINEFVNKHIAKIQSDHLKALTKSEVIITPEGPNKFNEFAMKALYGRCFMFIDAKKLQISKVVRKSAT